MKSYIVERPEVHYAKVRIEADSPEEAERLVRDDCEGDELDYLEYSHTLEEGWIVSEDDETDEQEVKYSATLEEWLEDD